MASPQAGRDGDRQILGVRTSRNAPLLFVASGGIHADPGMKVIVRLDDTGKECEASVAIGAGQLISATGVRTAGTVLRLA